MAVSASVENFPVMTTRWLNVLRSSRWLLLLLYALFLFQNPAPQANSQVVTLHILSMAALAVLLTRLGAPMSVTLWVWVILLVFTIGYFFPVWLLARDVADRLQFVFTRYPGMSWLTLYDVADSMRWITLAFVTFCLSAWLVVGGPRSAWRRVQRMSLSAGATDNVVVITLVTLIVALGAAYLRARLGIGIAGVDVAQLPFRFGTILNRLVIDIAPTITLLALWSLETQPARWKWMLASGSLLAQAVAYTVWSTSRGGFIRFLLPLLFMWLIAGRMNRGRIAAVALVIILTVVAFPLISYLRLMRMTADMRLSQAFQFARELDATKSRRDSLKVALMIVATRTTGADAVLTAQRYLPHEFSVTRAIELVRMPVEEHYTRRMAMISNPNDHAAPGLVGTFMILGGVPGVLILTVAFVTAVRTVWSLLARLRVAPVALAVFATALLAYTSDGGSSPQNLIAAILSGLAAEVVYRILMTRRLAHQRRHPAVHTSPQTQKI
jgi:hypothetical protein